jgi:hypothetical protein
MMEKQGYDRSWSTALVAVAGVLAMLIPPSNPFIIYCGVTETPVGPMFLAGILPGTLLVIISFHPETPSSLVGEGLPCGVRLNTPQGKGEGEELKNSFRLLIPLPFIPSRPGRGIMFYTNFFTASGREGGRERLAPYGINPEAHHRCQLLAMTN